jgi:hypothetical protein
MRKNNMKQIGYTLLSGSIALGSLFATNAHALPATCQYLTPAAIQQTITIMNNSLALANLDFAKNGVTGSYAVAAKINRDQIIIARNEIVTTQSWLRSINLDKPYVSNASASYSIYLSAMKAIDNLLVARHWSGISAIYHSSLTARQSVDSTTQALYLLEKLGEKATICYVDQWAPFTQ